MFMHALWMEESAMLDPYSQPCPIARMDRSVDYCRYFCSGARKRIDHTAVNQKRRRNCNNKHSF